MPSQDDYLDSFLKGLSSEENDEEELDGASMDDLSPDLDVVTNLTEEEIDRILSVKSEGTGEKTAGDVEAQGDVLDMLDGTGDGDLQEIQDLLGKSDRNENIREDALPEDNPADRLLADIEGAGSEEDTAAETDKKKRRALLKERRRQEKAAKKAARKSSRQKKNKKKSGSQEDILFDKDMLDGIVTGAEQYGHGGSQTKAAGGMEVEEVDLEEAAGMVPDVEAEFAALDMDEVDALIPDISEKKEGKKQEKQGFIAKALSFLLEEEEEEPENEDIQLSDENQRILDELDGEEGKAQKGDKGKKDKKKGKKKDGKKKIKEKKAKPPKKVKEKKPKKPKEAESAAPGRKLSFKKMLPIILLGITVGAVVFIFVGISTDFISRQAAETAFADGDYEECYVSLYGKKRNESEEAMFGKSESILYIRLWQREYELLAGEGRETEALDSLIQTVNGYAGLYEHASRYDATEEVAAVYFDMLGVLYEKYALSEAQALEIAAVTSDIEYTRIVTALAEGKSYKQWGKPETPQPEEDGGQVLPDELPEEAEMEQGGFVDNQ